MMQGIGHGGVVGDATIVGSVGDLTIVSSVVDATIFWIRSVQGSLGCAFGECTCYCGASFKFSFTLDCPWLLGMPLLCCSVQIMVVLFAVWCSFLTSHLSCLMFFPPMFVLSYPCRTCAKFVAAVTVASALFIVGIVMYFCLKNRVSAICTLLLALTHIL